MTFIGILIPAYYTFYTPKNSVVLYIQQLTRVLVTAHIERAVESKKPWIVWVVAGMANCPSRDRKNNKPWRIPIELAHSTGTREGFVFRGSNEEEMRNFVRPLEWTNSFLGNLDVLQI